MSPAPFYTLTAGDLTVTAVSDGLMSAPLSLLSGISREEAEHLQRHSGLASPETIAIGAYLIRGRGNTVLVDTGTRRSQWRWRRTYRQSGAARRWS